MYKCVNGVMSEMTEEEVQAFEAVVSALPPEDIPEQEPGLEERIDALETGVDELHEALGMILTGVTE